MAVLLAEYARQLASLEHLPTHQLVSVLVNALSILCFLLRAAILMSVFKYVRMDLDKKSAELVCLNAQISLLTAPTRSFIWLIASISSVFYTAPIN